MESFSFSCTFLLLKLLFTFLTLQLTKVQSGGLVSPNAFTSCRLASFAASDRLAIPFFRYDPCDAKNAESDSESTCDFDSSAASAAAAKLPCLLMIHGGPEAQSRPSFSYLVQYFLSQRFVVIVPNIRGSTGYGRSYVQADDVLKRLDSTRDIAELAQHLVSESKNEEMKSNSRVRIDPELMFVYGGSYGGFAVLSAMTEYPTLWAGGVDLFGIADFETFLEATAPWRRALREVEYGRLDVPEERAFLRRLSPVHRVSHVQAPLFLFQGDRDERVPLNETLQMYDRLLALGKPVTLVRASDEGHGITKRANVLRVYSQIMAFLVGVVNEKREKKTL
jgi:dipeptidyl aminopeptidase/acylaminoacyl peptidase